ncbi:MAG TPA: response regulator transcription factor [Sedimentibacter sp.]|nr:response regulator transcription factor [Sedimentibacter sp.]
MKIIIVDDHPLVRQGLASLVSMESDMELIGECSNVQEALTMIDEKKPDLAIIDLKLGKESGLEIVSADKEHKCKYVILTSSAAYADFKKSEEVNVDGYVLKEALPEELLYALRLVGRGRKYYDPVLLEYKLQEGNDNLTLREKEVLQKLGQGLNNQEIADELFISENTVKKHVSQILAKLNLHDRTQAALYANNMNI